jgi:HK97 family phage prohead protease
MSETITTTNLDGDAVTLEVEYKQDADGTPTEMLMVAPYQRCAINPEVKASNEADREVLHLISTAAIDRAGDIVEPGGVDLGNYTKNPIVMRNHSYLTQDIIGRATKITVDDDGIWARTRFRDSEVGREAFKLSAERLGGWSVGFRPIEFDSIKDDKGNHKGIRFKRWELLEYSQVPIPMNQEAVQAAVQRGLVSAAHVNLFFNVEAVEPPVEKTASDGTKAEPQRIDIHPAMLAIARAQRRLDLAAAAEQIENIERNTR